MCTCQFAVDCIKKNNLLTEIVQMLLLCKLLCHRKNLGLPVAEFGFGWSSDRRAKLCISAQDRHGPEEPQE